jgi:hypothetical protein
VLAAKAEEVRK